MMEYFNYKKAKSHQDHAEKSEAPVLTEEDEAFLTRIASEGEPPPLPERPQDLPVAGETRGNDAQIALMNGAQDIPLPDVPDTPDDVLPGIEGENDGKGKQKAASAKDGKRPFTWSFLRRDSRDAKAKDRAATATGLHGIAQGLKDPDAQPNEDGQVPEHEAKKEEEEMTVVLEQLNLAAVNNRVFSISKESQELLRKFTLVLKDLVNGVPTAYGDLESLLTNSEQQLQKSYSSLPSFLQKLIEQLPSKFTGSLGPEILAAGASRVGLSSAYATQAAGVAERAGFRMRVPNLKDLVSKPGAVAGMLRSIMAFLRARFPAFMGMNVLWSLALFVLLFVFWYCHKRGREVRLEKERALTEAERAQLEQDIASDPALQTFSTTTAPDGAPIEQVREGMHASKEQEEGTGPASENDASVPPSSGPETNDPAVEAQTYAPEGSLAQDLKEKAKAQDMDDDTGEKPTSAKTS